VRAFLVVLLLATAGCIGVADTLICPAGCPDSPRKTETTPAGPQSSADECLFCQGGLAVGQYSPEFIPVFVVRVLVVSAATGEASPPPSAIEHPPRQA